MNSEPAARSQLDADAIAVLKVLSRGYRKMTADDVAHAHAFALVEPDRVHAALAKLENAGFVQQHVRPTATKPRARQSRYGLTPLGRSVAAGPPEMPVGWA